ncbi:unnamed protein product [Bathycoccus prasinos]
MQKKERTRANTKSFIRRRRRKNNNSGALASSSSNEETTLTTTIQTGEGEEESKSVTKRRISSTLSSTSFTTSPNKTSLPPRTCSEAAIEARNVLRYLREKTDVVSTKRVRVELPLPRESEDDRIVWLGLHGQASDWSGGMSERLAKTKVVVETMLSGYAFRYLGLLDKDAEGMGLWTATEDMSIVAHPSDTTIVPFFLNLLRGEYGERVVNEREHFLVVVNGFWSGNGEKVGQPWQFRLREEAKEYLATDTIGEEKRWEKVYSCRRARSAAGIEGTLVRRYPEPWSLFDARGVRLLKQWRDEPSNREIAETLNEDAGQAEAVGFTKDASETSRDDDVIS